MDHESRRDSYVNTAERRILTEEVSNGGVHIVRRKRGSGGDSTVHLEVHTSFLSLALDGAISSQLNGASRFLLKRGDQGRKSGISDIVATSGRGTSDFDNSRSSRGNTRACVVPCTVVAGSVGGS